MYLKEKFLNLIGKYSKDEEYNEHCWTEIAHNYSSTSRYYHTLKHIEHMINEKEKVTSSINDVDTFLFSIYYHDVIYEATKKDNEYQSAVIFEKRISKTSFAALKDCMGQIEATKDHALSNNVDTNILLDIDLSILGQSNEMYKQYAQNVRKEYQIYPDFMYRKGRKKVLKKMLEYDTIYKTTFFKEAYENRAVENIQLELKDLE